MSLLDDTLRLATFPARLGFRVADGAVRTVLHTAGALRQAEPGQEPAPAPAARPESDPEPPILERRPVVPEPAELDPRDTVAPVDPGPLETPDPPAPARPEPPAVADPGVEMVAEFGEEGAEEPAGAEVHVEPPFEGYDSLKVGEVRERLQAADRMQVAGVMLYERSAQGRRGVIAAAEKRLASLDSAGG